MITLVTVAIALLCNGTFAYAPIIGAIPDVYIGDEEDNAGHTIDLNFFRFSDAFNFDLYVSKDPNDDDQSTTNVRWSFMTSGAATDLITINGINTIASSSEALMPDLVSKELTSYPNNDATPRATSWADFYDLVDSPGGEGAAPWIDPLTNPDPDAPLDTMITIYASNGTKADSRTIMVKAHIDSAEVDMPDKLSGGWPPALTHVVTWSSPATDGWTKSGPADGFLVTADTGDFYIATRTTSGGSIGAETRTDGASVWGPWDAPTFTYVADQVWRARYTCRTTQTDGTKVPGLRLYMQFVNTATSTLAVAGGNRVGTEAALASPFVADADGETYAVYVGPPDLSGTDVNSVKVQFEVIDFATNEEGTNYLDSCDVYRFDKPDKALGTLEKTYTPTDMQAEWSSVAFSSPFGSATVGSNSTGLFITTPATVSAPVAGNIDVGLWSRGASSGTVSFEADKLYRCVYTLSVSSAGEQATAAKARVYNASQTGTYSALLELVTDQTQAHMPDTSGKEYDVWFETLPTLYTDANRNQMSFNFDISDGSNTQQGTMYLEKVDLYYYSIP
jgi:hypothetical protein